MSFITIYITHSDKAAAQKFTDQLLQKRMVACANIFPITSAYWWQGAIANEDEWVSLVKTQSKYWPRLQTYLVAIHPYEVPCIMKSEVEANSSYEAWIEEMTMEADFGDD